MAKTKTLAEAAKAVADPILRACNEAPWRIVPCRHPAEREGLMAAGSRSISEAQARTLWCPFARLIAGDASTVTQAPGGGNNVPDPAGYNRPATGNPVGLANALCQASNCMAWRWSPIDQSVGHCGLAGTP